MTAAVYWWDILLAPYTGLGFQPKRYCFGDGGFGRLGNVQAVQCVLIASQGFFGYFSLHGILQRPRDMATKAITESITISVQTSILPDSDFSMASAA